MSTQELEVPVLVVGAGPAGLTSALALGRYGHAALVVERHAGTAHTPRAHIINQRTIEILRHLGIEDRFHAVATPQALMRDNLWVTSLAGLEIARSEAWGTGVTRSSDYAAASPVPMGNCPQTVFEPLLLDAAREAGADVRFEHEFVSFTQDEQGVTSTVRDRRTDEIITIRSQYLIGADGARSVVAQQLGVTLEGPSGLANAANVWFEADLTKYLAHRPGVLVWNVMPGPHPPLRLGTLICHKPFTEFVFVCMYDPATEDLSSISDEEAARRVRLAVGDPDLKVEIKGIAGWQVNAQVAPKYADGRVFCMGDAVHRHPPTNGLGLNLSVADAFNLAWKLALVMKGRAGGRLLETYSDERQPVGASGVQRAITSLGEMAAIDEALGFEPGQSVEDGWAALELLNQPGPEGDARREALQSAVAVTDYQFNAHGVELGYRYSSAAIITDPSPEEPPARDPELYYQSTTRPGARVAHARIERAGQAASTIDLVDGLGLSLITGSCGAAWADIAAAVSGTTGAQITVHVVGGHDDRAWLDPYGEWSARSEVEADGAVLVRPDRHVAWRSATLTADSAKELTEVVQTVLALDETETTPESSADVPEVVDA